MTEEKRKPTLTNDKKRRDYAEDPANWEYIDSLSLRVGTSPTIVLQRLKGTMIYRLAAFVAADASAMPWIPEESRMPERYESINAFEFAGDGHYCRSTDNLSITAIVQKLKELKL